MLEKHVSFIVISHRTKHVKPGCGNVTCSGIGNIFMARMQRQSEYVMVKTEYERQPGLTCRQTVTMLLWPVARKCCGIVVGAHSMRVMTPDKAQF